MMEWQSLVLTSQQIIAKTPIEIVKNRIQQPGSDLEMLCKTVFREDTGKGIYMVTEIQ